MGWTAEEMGWQETVQHGYTQNAEWQGGEWSGGMGWTADEGRGWGNYGWEGAAGWPAAEGGQLCWSGETAEEPEEVMRFCSVLWVGSLPPRCTEDEVLAAFRIFGPIASVVVKNQTAASSLAFVNFMNEDAALTAYDHMYDGEIGGYEVKLREPQAKELLCPAWPINLDVLMSNLADEDDPGWAAWCAEVGWGADAGGGWGCNDFEGDFEGDGLAQGEDVGLALAPLSLEDNSEVAENLFPNILGEGSQDGARAFDPMIDNAAWVGPSWAAAAAAPKAKVAPRAASGGDAQRKRELIAVEACGRVELYGTSTRPAPSDHLMKPPKDVSTKLGAELAVGEYFCQNLTSPKLVFKRCQEIGEQYPGETQLTQALVAYLISQLTGASQNGTPFVSVRGCPQWAVEIALPHLLQRFRRTGETREIVVVTGVGGQDLRNGKHKHSSHTKGQTLDSRTRDLLLACREVDESKKGSVRPLFTVGRQLYGKGHEVGDGKVKFYGSFLVRLAAL